MHVIEWAVFRLKAGVTHTQLLAAAQAIQPALQAQKGYAARQLLPLQPGRYADMVTWSHQADAEAALAALLDFPSVQAYFSLMEIDTQPVFFSPIFTHVMPVAEPTGAVNVPADALGAQPPAGLAGTESVQGMEFSLFRLRQGADAQALSPAARRMAASLYEGQAGFVSHMVLRCADSANGALYADVILAESAEQARNLCGRWGTGPYHADCTDYLDLMDPHSVELAFWSRVV